MHYYYHYFKLLAKKKVLNNCTIVQDKLIHFLLTFPLRYPLSDKIINFINEHRSTIKVLASSSHFAGSTSQALLPVDDAMDFKILGQCTTAGKGVLIFE